MGAAFVEQREQYQRMQHEQEIVRLFENYRKLAGMDAEGADN